MSHTPGPWKLGKGHGSAVVSEHAIPGVRPNTGHADIDYYGGYLIAESIFRKDDSRLIAAAPDLLKELKHLVSLLEPVEDTLNVPGLATLNGARAAIAKAEGEI